MENMWFPKNNCLLSKGTKYFLRLTEKISQNNIYG